MFVNKNRMAEMLSPQGRARAQDGVRKLEAELRVFLRDRNLTGMTDDMIDAVLNTGTVIGAFYNVMFEMEAETRLYMGEGVDDALTGTTKTLMERGADIMAEQLVRTDHYQALKEQLDRNKHG